VRVSSVELISVSVCPFCTTSAATRFLYLFIEELSKCIAGDSSVASSSSLVDLLSVSIFSFATSSVSFGG